MWSWIWLEQLWRDVRYGLRGMRRNPGFTAVAVIALALGIGANSAIFTAVDAILLRPLGYRDPERLVVILNHGSGPVAPANFADWKAQSRTRFTLGISTDGKKLYIYGAGFEIEVYDASTLKYERTWDLNNHTTMAGRVVLPCSRRKPAVRAPLRAPGITLPLDTPRRTWHRSARFSSQAGALPRSLST